MEKASYCIGAVSLVTWLIAMLPQIVEIYKAKSGSGISRVFIGIWFVCGTGRLWFS